ADAKAAQVNQFFETTARAITAVQTGLDSVNSGAEYLIRQQQIFGFDFIHLTNLNGAILESSDTTLESRTFLDPDGSSFAAGHLRVHFSPVFKENGKYFLFVLAPAKTTSGDGLIIAKQSLDNLYKSLTDYRGLG